MNLSKSLLIKSWYEWLQFKYFCHDSESVKFLIICSLYIRLVKISQTQIFYTKEISRHKNSLFKRENITSGKILWNTKNQQFSSITYARLGFGYCIYLHFFIKENVAQFQISMNNLAFVQIWNSQQYLIHKIPKSKISKYLVITFL